MSPGAIVRLAGDPDKVKALLVPEETTVTVVEPQIAPAHALTVDVPPATPKTRPLLVESDMIIEGDHMEWCTATSSKTR